MISINETAGYSRIVYNIYSQISIAITETVTIIYTYMYNEECVECRWCRTNLFSIPGVFGETLEMFNQYV